MSVKFGVSPIAWINDDMPELGGDTPVVKVLADARDIGFSGIELGGKFPRDAGVLKALLDEHDLELVGGWYSANLLTRSASEEIDALQSHLRLLEAMDCNVFVIAETSNAIHSDRAAPLRATPRLAPERWPEFGSRLTDVAAYVAARGFRFAYHHHLGTVVETAEDLARFLQHTGDHVGLTLDTGHATLGGIDPLAVIADAPGRIAHVHCKDVRGDTFRKLIARNGSFLEGVLDGMFTVPGDGDIAFEPILGRLMEFGYSGWIIVEAEQDPAIADPFVYGQLGLRTLRAAAAAVSLEEAA
jgi:inosose dehydratase